MLNEMYGGEVKMRPALLEPSTKRQILARMRFLRACSIT